MSEKKNIFDDDLLMREILEGGQEEVPARVWDAVSEGLDKAAAKPSGKTVTLWWRRAGIASAAVAAAVTAVLVVNRPQNEDFVPKAVAENMIAVVEPEVMTVEEVGEKMAEEAIKANSRMVAYAPKAVRTAGAIRATDVTDAIDITSATDVTGAEEIVARSAEDDPIAFDDGSEAELTAKTAMPAEESPVTDSQKYADDRSDKVPEEEIYFPTVWEDEVASRQVKTSLIVSGITGASGSGAGAKAGLNRAPSVLLSPSKTGISESRSKQSLGLPVSVGAGARFEFSSRWSLGVGLNYTLLTRTFNGTYTKVNGVGGIEKEVNSGIRNTQHFIGIPVNAYFNIVENRNVNFYAYAGGAVEKCLADNYLVQSEHIVHKESAQGAQLSANIGLGAEFMLSDYVGLYLDPSLRYYFDCDQPKSIRTIQPLMLGFEVGFRFRL